MGWEKRVTVRETHALWKEVTPGKVFAADFIVVGFDRGVLCGAEHGLDFGMSGQLEQVIVVSRVAAQRLTVALQQLDFAVDCEHLLDKCSPKMQKAQNEGSFIFGAEGQLVLLEVLTQVGSQFDNNRRLAAAGRACFEKNPVRNFARPAEFSGIVSSFIAIKLDIPQPFQCSIIKSTTVCSTTYEARK